MSNLNQNELIIEKDFNIKAKLINEIHDLKRSMQSFSLQHTQVAKGIASLMLLYHHLLRPGNKFIKLLKNELTFFGIDLRNYAAIFFKITTCTYTFLSGIGIYYSLIKFKNIKDMYKKCMENFLRLMIIFWIILLIAYPKGLKTGLFDLKFSTVISCFFADYYKKGNWWYIRMHFALLIYSPMFIRLFQDISYKSKIFPFIIFYFSYSIIKTFQYFYKIKGLEKIFFDYFNYFSNIDLILSFWS